MARYLSVAPEKLRSKGVASVRARVCNLAEYVPGLTARRLVQALLDAFGEVYGSEPELFAYPLDAARLRALEEKFSDEWRFGREPRADCTLSGRWPWGGAELCLTVAGGRVTAATVYTDAMDAGLAAALEACPHRQPLCRAVPGRRGAGAGRAGKRPRGTPRDGAGYRRAAGGNGWNNLI